MFDSKRTKIVCTLGPATEDDDVLRNMIRNGMNVARLNFSHGSHDYHRKNIERVRRISKELGTNIAIMTDTKGPEIRTRYNEDHRPILLVAGDKLRICAEDTVCTNECITVDYTTLAGELKVGDVIFVDDGLIELEVEAIGNRELHCVVVNGGTLNEQKGVNIPNVAVNLPAVTDRDREDIRFSCEMGVDAIAVSFVRNAAAVEEVRDLCMQFGAPDTQIISKVESSFAIKHFKEILKASDGIMVARGDLGVEIPPADVPGVQKKIIAMCNKEYRPVITATQMLDSMTHNPRPTRAEISDVANAIEDGTDCVMLSAETAAGNYPVKTVKTMAQICRKAEEHLLERNEYHDRGGRHNVSGATGYAAVTIARLVGAKALICPTISGRTARIMSTFRPHLPIIATAPVDTTLRRTCFYWGVEGIMANEQGGTMQICYDAIEQAKNNGLLQSGDIAVITSGDALSSPMLYDGEITPDTPTNVCITAQVM